MAWRAFSVIVVALLSGCIGGGAGTPASETQAPLDESSGLLRVHVYDEELRPIPNSTVGVATLALSALTDLQGTAEIPRLPPGSYDVSALALGYSSQARRVAIEAGQVADVTFHLPVLPANASYHETYPYTGFEACQWYVPVALAHCTLAYTQAYGAAGQHGVNLSQYGLPRDLQDNRDRYNVSIRLDHRGVVSELTWQAGSALAAIQSLVIMCPWYDPVADECVPPGEVTTGVRYFAKVGTSPLRIEWKHPNLKHLAMSPWFMSRANVNGNITERPAGIALEQKIQMFNTVFYGADPPPGFTAVSDQ